ncbi:hypothetical protein C8N29_10795 [Agitococcus lubricus]|uniref:Uncharacterized protein n=2 Tax=Agitococcus lubricus TaxID=1077255 RepID=A0A2T5IZD7_9GAMM|nr:hypothetical protein C8N29_10795 [Agitococcus lubricus]
MNKLMVMSGLMLSMGAGVVQAAPNHAEIISVCLADATSGKDRKDLSRFIFAVMAKHPAVGSIANISTTEARQIERTAGELYNRLFTQDCRQPIKAAINDRDQAAVGAGFEYLGKLAMQELMSDKGVADGFMDIVKYVDIDKIANEK